MSTSPRSPVPCRYVNLRMPPRGHAALLSDGGPDCCDARINVHVEVNRLPVRPWLVGRLAPVSAADLDVDAIQTGIRPERQPLSAAAVTHSELTTSGHRLDVDEDPFGSRGRLVLRLQRQKDRSNSVFHADSCPSGRAAECATTSRPAVGGHAVYRRTRRHSSRVVFPSRTLSKAS